MTIIMKQIIHMITIIAAIAIITAMMAIIIVPNIPKIAVMVITAVPNLSRFQSVIEYMNLIEAKLNISNNNY